MMKGSRGTFCSPRESTLPFCKSQFQLTQVVAPGKSPHAQGLHVLANGRSDRKLAVKAEELQPQNQWLLACRRASGEGNGDFLSSPSRRR